MADKPIKVLLIEDNPIDVRAIKGMLEGADFPFDVEKANRLTTGMKILAEKNKDVILLDLTLPDCQGVETFLRLHNKFPDLPIVVFTGVGDEELSIKVLRKGAQDYLVKGEVNTRLMVRAIRYAIERHRLRVELKRIYSELRESETRLNALIQRSSDGILIVDSNRVIHFANAAAELIFDRKAEELIGELFDFPVVAGEARTIEIIRGDGEKAIVEMLVVETEIHGLTFYMVTLRDITEPFKHARKEEKLQEMTLVDELTGLYNRRGFYTLADQLIKVANFTKKNMILFFIDLDRLKYINDNFGHSKGDQALVDIAQIIRKTFRGSDVIARFGGDEFVALAIDAHKEIGEKLYTRMQKNLNAHNAEKDRPYKLAMSIGIAHYDPESPCSIKELIKEADKLMYEQKVCNQQS